MLDGFQTPGGKPFESLRWMHFLMALLIKQNGGPLEIDTTDEVELDQWHLAARMEPDKLVIALHEDCDGVNCPMVPK